MRSIARSDPWTPAASARHSRRSPMRAGFGGPRRSKWRSPMSTHRFAVSISVATCSARRRPPLAPPSPPLVALARDPPWRLRTSISSPAASPRSSAAMESTSRRSPTSPPARPWRMSSRSSSIASRRRLSPGWLASRPRSSSSATQPAQSTRAATQAATGARDTLLQTIDSASSSRVLFAAVCRGQRPRTRPYAPQSSAQLSIIIRLIQYVIFIVEESALVPLKHLPAWGIG